MKTAAHALSPDSLPETRHQTRKNEAAAPGSPVLGAGRVRQGPGWALGWRRGPRLEAGRESRRGKCGPCPFPELSAAPGPPGGKWLGWGAGGGLAERVRGPQAGAQNDQECTASGQG